MTPGCVGLGPVSCLLLFPRVEGRLGHTRCLAMATGGVAPMLLSTRKDPQQARGHGVFLCPAGPSGLVLALKYRRPALHGGRGR